MRQQDLFATSTPQGQPATFADVAGYAIDADGSLLCVKSKNKPCPLCRTARREWSAWCAALLRAWGYHPTTRPARYLFSLASGCIRSCRLIAAGMKQDGWPTESIAAIARDNKEIEKELAWISGLPAAICSNGDTYEIVTYAPRTRGNSKVWARARTQSAVLGRPIKTTLARRISSLTGIPMGGIGGTTVSREWLVVLGLEPMPSAMTCTHERPTDMLPEDYYA